MITPLDFYHVMTAMVPLYVAMMLAYGSVRWWNIFTPDQCSGINRFVALFAVPLLSFHFIASNNPYTMNMRFIAADTLQKVIVLSLLAVWTHLSRRGCIDWAITLFSVATLPNTLVMGIPLLKGMYGDFSGSLMVQIVVLQCIIWYTIMLFLFEFRAARFLITEQFPHTAGAIASIVVDPDVMSLDAGRDALETDAEITEDGKLHVVVRRSNASRSDIYSRRSMGFSANTPRASNLTNAEIYSLQSSRNPTPRGSSFNHSDFYSMVGGAGRNSNFGQSDVFGTVLPTSRGPTPRQSSYYEDHQSANAQTGGSGSNKSRIPLSTTNSTSAGTAINYPVPNPGAMSPTPSAPTTAGDAGPRQSGTSTEEGGVGGRDLHMFVWNSNTSPVSDVFGSHQEYGLGPAAHAHEGPVPVKDVRMMVSPRRTEASGDGNSSSIGISRDIRDQFSFGNRAKHVGTNTTTKTVMDDGLKAEEAAATEAGREKASAMPPTSVMTRLILIMVWRKLIRNPNTYSSLIGLTWSLISFR